LILCSFLPGTVTDLPSPASLDDFALPSFFLVMAPFPKPVLVSTKPAPLQLFWFTFVSLRTA